MIAALGRAGRRLTWPMLLLAGLALLAAVAVFPTRTYLDKRAEVASAQARLEQLSVANDAAQAHVDELGTDAEIERIARAEYGLVKAGEESYRVTPEAQDPVLIPDVWPFNRLRQHIG
jgi:cell division protein FtsB